jgi:Zn-finger nucleic acid-binding protein
MTCPSCGGELTELDRSGVRIDACRSCRGVWLDRGELDKIIEREAREGGDDDDFVRELTGAKTKRRDDDDDDRRPYDARSSSGHYPPKKKKRGFLGEMFEFGD